MASTFVAVHLKHIDLIRDGRTVLRDVAWTIRPGERWLLAGANGAGKTQLLKLVAGSVWPTPTGRESRVYRWNGERWSTPFGVQDEIGYVGAERQDKYERYGWNHTVEQIVGTGLYRTDIPLDPLTDHDRRRIAALLARLDVQHLAARPFLSLSYGERRLTLLARVLASQPKLLLLDELLNGLDAVNRANALRWLAGTRRTRVPWVLATHRMEDVPSGVTHALILESGKIVYRGPMTRAPLQRWLDAGQSEPQARGARSSAAAALARASGAHVAGWPKSFGRKSRSLKLPAAGQASRPQAMGLLPGAGEQDVPQPEHEMRERSAVHPESGEEPTMRAAATAPGVRAVQRPEQTKEQRSQHVLVRLARAHVYLDGSLVLKRISLEVRVGECWVVHGPNGSGKSTLLRTIYGDHAVAAGGHIERAGIEPGVHLDTFKQRVGLVAPHLQTDHPQDLTVAEVVQSGRYASIGLNDAPLAADRIAARKALAFFGLEDFESRTVRELSYGQLRRVLFARAWVNRPELLLLDEPFAGIDTPTRRELLRHIDELVSSGVSVIMATHHREEWPQNATHELELRQGEAAYTGAVRPRMPGYRRTGSS